MSSKNDISEASNSQASDDLFPELPDEVLDHPELKHYPLSTAIKPSSQHAVLYKVTSKSWDEWQIGYVPLPHPTSTKDVWDSNHVRMPYSSQNVYPLNGTLVNRWELIEKSLLNEIHTSYDIEEAILTYNTQYAQQWDFKGLHLYFKNMVTPEEAAKLFDFTIPGMIRLALNLPLICTRPIPLLRKKSDQAISLSQYQIACLLANAFFCTYPRRNAVRKKGQKPTEYFNYPDINFNKLFGGSSHRLSCRQMKLKALFHYFTRVLTIRPSGVVTFHRQCIHQFPDWIEDTHQLGKLTISSEGVIETDGKGMLQVDFANKMVGGGVLGSGCVQEEIRFVICPELLISRLFTEVLDSNEVLLAKGCEQYSEYSGYSDSFTWVGDFKDQTPRDESGRLKVKVVAMDALHFSNKAVQYQISMINRELNKAYCGFFEPHSARQFAPVATGNWGCGAFNGDPLLKSLIQWMAASVVGRDLVYFTFKDNNLKDELEQMRVFLHERKLNVGDLYVLLSSFSNSLKKDPLKQLYPFIYEALSQPRTPEQ